MQVTRDNQQITALELKMTTQKSRVSELEGSLNLSQESTNKVRKQALLDQEKLAATMKEVYQYTQFTTYDPILDNLIEGLITKFVLNVIVLIKLQLEAGREECINLAAKLASAETRMQDAERRTEALATLQSHRWMEFSKMADNMKELSGAMVITFIISC